MKTIRINTIILVGMLIMSLMLHRYELKSAKADEVLIGKASWYSKNDPTDPFEHKTNADGSGFNETDFTCAMRSREFGKRYKVTNLNNGKSIIVTHRDYNPFRKYKGRDISDRIIDLTKRAFAEICNLEEGLVKVKIEEIE